MFLKSLVRSLGAAVIVLPVFFLVLIGIVIGLLCFIFGEPFINVLFGPVGLKLFFFLPGVIFLGSFAIIHFGSADDESEDEKKKRAHLSRKSPAETLLFILLFCAFMLIPLFGIPGIAAFVALFILNKMMPTAQSRFMHYQRNLPTSSVRSMATGIVELEGKLVAGELLKAPLSGRRCIGYRYTIEEQERDSDGKNSIRVVHDEQCCNAFMLEDQTGKVQVEAGDLDFHFLSVAKRRRSGRQSEQEYLLLPGERYLLIGQAARRGNDVVIARDKFRRIFGIAPVGNLKRRGKLEVLFRSSRVYIIATALAIALVLMLPVEVQPHQLILHFERWSPVFDFTSLFTGQR